MHPSNLCEKELDIYPQQIHRWVFENKYTEPVRCQLFKRYLVNRPVFVWIGEWTTGPKRGTRETVNHAKANSALFQIVIHNVPNRESGGFTEGGRGTRKAYLSFIREVARGIGNAEGLVVLEPHALPFTDKFDQLRRERRLDLIREAVMIIKKKCKNTLLYIDAGHPKWLKASMAIEHLLRAGIRHADGISLNVENAYTDEQCYLYGIQILGAISGTHGMIIDSSRNGAGPPPPYPEDDGTAWANNPFLRLGRAPTFRIPAPNIFSDRLHALVWVKTPGESDGPYRGAPPPGVFWPEEALRLIGCGDVLSIGSRSSHSTTSDQTNRNDMIPLVYSSKTTRDIN